MMRVIAGTPLWMKTTATSWCATITGVGFFHIGQYKEDIQAWAALIGGIVIPTVALLIHIYKTFKKND